jgi:protein ImuB
LRLFERPEPVETIALFPDGPPVRFRWRRVLHEVVSYEGPERLAPPWWGAAQSGPTRDYFQAQDRDGRLFWLFREGLYGREAGTPRWFVHGLS